MTKQNASSKYACSLQMDATQLTDIPSNTAPGSQMYIQTKAATPHSHPQKPGTSGLCENTLKMTSIGLENESE